MKYRYHKDMDPPRPGEIFVFGSNLAGRHGAGAARYALDNCGARGGIGWGPYRHSFAIPTKDVQLKTCPLAVINFLTDQFIVYASENSSKNFFITRIGCGLAGYTDSDIAPMFRGAPTNCDFPEEWKQYLEG